MQRDLPILEFDETRQAIVEPHPSPTIDMPEHCVVCFFQEVIEQLSAAGQVQTVTTLKSEIGTHPVYELDVLGRRLGLFHPGVGAPLAVAFLEEVIALGGKRFIACGGAGVLDPAITVGHLVVPTAAVRDEGTSYHYLPPGREVAPSPEGVAAIERVLSAHGVPYVTGKTWTTDGLYRETVKRMQLRQAEGCITVDMEASAFFAVAQFRDVTFAQILYGGDDLTGEAWDSRDWTTHAVREQLFWLAAEACLSL